MSNDNGEIIKYASGITATTMPKIIKYAWACEITHICFA